MAVTVKFGDTEFKMDGMYYPGSPAITDKLPEDCDPGEGSYFESDGVTVDGQDAWELINLVYIRERSLSAEGDKYVLLKDVLEGLACAQLDKDQERGDFDEFYD